MTRLIDADKMCADLLTVDPQFKTMIDWCIRVTEAQPTVDAVPVIRCKDCKWNTAVEWVHCAMLGGMFGRTIDNYCSRAERKEE